MLALLRSAPGRRHGDARPVRAFEGNGAAGADVVLGGRDVSPSGARLLGRQGRRRRRRSPGRPAGRDDRLRGCLLALGYRDLRRVRHGRLLSLSGPVFRARAPLDRRGPRPAPAARFAFSTAPRFAPEHRAATAGRLRDVARPRCTPPSTVSRSTSCLIELRSRVDHSVNPSQSFRRRRRPPPLSRRRSCRSSSSSGASGRGAGSSSTSGSLFAALSLVTLRYYVHLAPLWVILSGGRGRAAAGGALAQPEAARSPDGEWAGLHGAPALRRARERSPAAAAVAGFTPDARVAPDTGLRDFTGGGGVSGGGGAAGSF